MKVLKSLLLTIALLFLLGFCWLVGGGFNAAADAPHSKAVYWLLDTARERSIAVRAAGVSVPPLGDPAQIARGAAEYAEMCEGCHRAPGQPVDEEFIGGLYPRPPDLSKAAARDPAQVFWAVKHGVKMSAMPAWGLSHDDATLWAIVAFTQKLPSFDADEYKALTQHAAEAHAAAHDAAHDATGDSTESAHAAPTAHSEMHPSD